MSEEIKLNEKEKVTDKTDKKVNTTKKPASLKQTAPAKVEKEAVEPVESVEAKTIETVEKTFTGEDLIWCRSTTFGGLSYVGAKTKRLYRFEALGDSTEIEFQDLVGEVSKGVGSDYIFKPLFIIDDEDVLKLRKPANFQKVKEFYETIDYSKDLEPVFEIQSYVQFTDALKLIPDGLRNTFLAIVGSKIETGELDSVKKIEAIDKYFGTDFKSVLLV